MKQTKTVRASRRLARPATRPVRANRRVIRSDEDIDTPPVDDEIIDDEIDDTDVEDAPAEEAELLFEAADVAEVLSEYSGEPVDYTVDDETTEVTFTIGDDEITITPEGDEEVVEESSRIRRSARKVAASRAARRARRVAASRSVRRPRR
jgi:hypothetical protein